jgi:hypothetical protein
MKVGLYPDEWFPVLVAVPALEQNSAVDIHEVPDELVARWKRAHNEFVAVQRELAKLIGEKCLLDDFEEP